MENSEFDIIKKYFTFVPSRSDVLLAGGDDCAIVSPAAKQNIVITTDTLISGVHFPETTSAEDIAYKALMVNLSDLAAMGATPAWITLAISLPEVNEVWLSAFSQQLKALLSKYNVSLIGGDTTKGALSITIQAMGLVEDNRVLRRDQAQTGDLVFVTGDIGDAAIGLHAMQNNIDDERLLPCIQRLNRPEARIHFAAALAGYCECAIDISDGMVADLGHVIEASGCGARIELAAIPLSDAAKYYFERYHQTLPENEIDWPLVLTGGDDYELCFTLNPGRREAVETLAAKHNVKLSCVGEITSSNKIEFINSNNHLVSFAASGFNHFQS